MSTPGSLHFVKAEFEDPPCTGLEAREADGTWFAATAYTHAVRRDVVLWYGGDTYEGLGGGYRWGHAGGCAPSAGGSGAAKRGRVRTPRLLDGDGDTVPVRWARGAGGKAPAPAPARAAVATSAPQAKSKSRFLPFGEALDEARSLDLNSVSQWKSWCRDGKRPPNVPADPQHTYKHKGWEGWGHWLGTGNTKGGAKHFLPFGPALDVARSHGLAGRTEWRVWCKEGLRPADVPANPNKIYKNGGWEGWGHWLGTGNTKGGKKEFLPFDEALAVARSFQLTTTFEWEAWCRNGMRPPNVPAKPDHTYQDIGWEGWGHWLGTGKIAVGRAHRGVARSSPRALAPKRARSSTDSASGSAAAADGSKRRRR